MEPCSSTAESRRLFLHDVASPDFDPMLRCVLRGCSLLFRPAIIWLIAATRVLPPHFNTVLHGVFRNICSYDTTLVPTLLEFCTGDAETKLFQAASTLRVQNWMVRYKCTRTRHHSYKFVLSRSTHGCH